MNLPKYPGCNCKDCPLRDRPIHVPPQEVPNAKLFIIAETPARTEEIEGVPLVGASGRLLNSALERFGYSRSEAFVTNAALCWPGPGKKLSPHEWGQILACCGPRVQEERKRCPGAVCLALGAKALRTLGGPASITAWAGGPITIGGGRVLPALHPAACLRRPSLIPVFKTWVGRAIQMARGTLPDWQWPEIIIEPNERMLQALEALKGEKVLGVDIENLGDALESDIRCIGVSSERVAVSVPVERGDLAPSIRAALVDVLRCPALKVLHNMQHDRLGLEAKGWELKGPFYDTLLAHATVAPQLPHDLGFVCSIETAGPRWKSELHSGSEDRGLAVFTRSPWEKLGPYNCKDAYMQCIIQPSLSRRVDETHSGHALLQAYHDLAEVAIRMRRKGAQVDPSRFQTHRETLNGRLEECRKDFAESVQSNPAWTLGKSGQHPSLRGLFFGRLGLQPVRYSEETGEPSLDNLALERYCSNPNSTISGLARTVLQYRKTSKLLGTYIDGLPLDRANLVHPIWKVYGTITGRWSSQEPNAQNIPKVMRDLYVPRPGCVLCAGDYSQLELRFVALFSGDTELLQAYKDGVDVHRLNASVCFGVPYEQVTDAQRKLAKIFVYGANYLGDPETIWRQLVVQFPATSLSLIYKAHKAWFKAHPNIRAWQMEMLRKAREEKYVEEPLSGRREYFHDGLIEPNKVVNFPIQGAAGTLINRAIVSLDRELDWSKEAILFQVHDELVLEGPDKSRLAGLLKTHMNQHFEHLGNSLDFPVEVKSGPDWGHMKALTN